MAEKISFDARVRPKGQITVPLCTRERAGIKEGDLLQIEARVVKRGEKE